MTIQHGLMQPAATGLLLGFVRITMFVAFLPLFGGRPIPNTVKIGLAVSLTGLFSLSFATSVPFSTGTNLSWGLLTWLVLREATLGAGMGWLLGLVLIPARIAGTFIAQEMGLTIASLTSATEDGSSNVIAELLDALVVLSFLSLNGHHIFFFALSQSWDWFPMGTSLKAPWELPNRDWLCGKILESESVGIALAAPIVFVLLLTTVGLLFIMRQAPQFNLFAFGMPVRLLMGLFLLALFGPDFISNSIAMMQLWLGVTT